MDTRQVPCTSDAECIVLYLKGDELCFTELVKHHRSGILRYISSYIHNHQQGEDILQDVLMDFVLLLRSGNYVEQGRVHHLLINMAHKRINEYLRNHSSHAISLALPEEEDEQPAELEQEESWQPTRSDMLRLRAYIRSMKERKRALFIKRYHGMSYEKISRTMSINSDAAKVEFSRMVKKLRMLLKKKQ